jgi:branched-chain amino acid transport system substrate-binding protein
MAAVLSLVAAACGSSSKSTTPSGSGASSGKITLGVLADLSGSCQGTGPSIVDGMNVAVDDLQAKGLTIGGKKYTIDLKVEDTASSNTTAVASTQSLIQDANVKFILGPTCSGFQLNGVAPVAAKANVFYYSNFPVPAMGDPSTAVATVKQFPYVFLDSPRTVDAAAGYVAGITKFFPDAKKVYYLLDNVGAPLIPAEKNYFDQVGVSMSGQVYDVKTTDFGPLLAKAKAANPDVLLYGVTEQPSLAILKQALDLGVAKEYYTTNGSCCSDPLSNAQGKPISSPWAGLAFPANLEYPSSDGASHLADALKAKNGKLRAEDSFAVVGYDQVQAVIQAMIAAGSTDDVAKVSEAFTTSTFNLIEGQGITFDAGHAPKFMNQDACLVKDAKVTCAAIKYPPTNFQSPPLKGS